MARRPRVFAEGLLYHVIVRGNHRQKTFLRDRDYQTYLERLATYRYRDGVRLYAYCLMPNHVHLLVEMGRTPLAKFMQSVQQSYTQYFNRRYQKVGHLFQGRYQAIVCDKDPYVLTLLRYIHLNPVRAKLVAKPEDYAYSGHQAYLRGQATAVLDPTFGLELLGGRQAYRRFVLEGLSEGHRDELYAVEDQRFLGAEGFGDRLKDKETQAPVVKPAGALSSALTALATKLKVNVGVLRGGERTWKVSYQRKLIAYLLVKRGGFSLGAVAKALGRDVATLCVLLSRFGSLIEEESTVSQNVEALSKIVKK